MHFKHFMEYFLEFWNHLCFYYKLCYISLLIHSCSVEIYHFHFNTKLVLTFTTTNRWYISKYPILTSSKFWNVNTNGLLMVIIFIVFFKVRKVCRIINRKISNHTDNTFTTCNWEEPKYKPLNGKNWNTYYTVKRF